MNRLKTYFLTLIIITLTVIGCSIDENILQSQLTTDQKTEIDTIKTQPTNSTQTTPNDSTQTNMPDGGAGQPGPSSNDPAIIKAEVLALFNTVGRTSQNMLKSASGSLPAGVSSNGNNITISGDGVILEDYDLRGYTIFLNSDNVEIKNCLLGENLAPRDSKRVIDIRANVKNFLIEDNDFVGFQGLGSGVSSGIFQRSLTSTESGIGGIIRRNRFKHLGQDCVKTTGGVLIEENVFYATSNVAAIPSGVWDSNTSYALNEVVKDTDSQKHFISLVANNANNALPNGNTSNANWQFYDPHYDIVNPFENTIPSIIRRNLFLTNTQDPMIPPADRSYAVGIVNALRLIRNNSTAPTNYESLLIEENVISGSAFYSVGFPIQAANAGGLWTNPTLKNNLIDANPNGKYTHPSTASAVDWQTNYDTSTLSSINP